MCTFTRSTHKHTHCRFFRSRFAASELESLEIAEVSLRYSQIVVAKVCSILFWAMIIEGKRNTNKNLQQ